MEQQSYIRSTAPPEEQPNPDIPAGAPPLIFESFAGINTSTTRPGVPDQQAYWLDGFMPLAPRNLRTLYGIGTAIYTASGTTVVCFEFANIGSTPYCVIFLANGQVVAVNMNTLTPTTILSAGTITSPSILNVGISQWGGQYIVIVANQTNGYWLWNGTLFQAGTLSPVALLTSTGAGYTVTPTALAVGGSGTGSSLSLVMLGGRVIDISVINPGSGYSVNEQVSINFTPGPVGGGGASLVAVLSNRTISSVSIVASGSLYATPTIVFTGGLPATTPQQSLTASVFNGSITGVSIGGITLNNDNTGWTTAPTLTAVDAGYPAKAMVQIMPFGVQGTDVETYQSRIWIIKGPLLLFSAPGNFASFATSDGGGNVTSGDSFLKYNYIRVIQSNGFLYLVADSSVNYISGVSTTFTSPPTTTFSNLNADPQTGTPYPGSVGVFGNNIMFANALGIYSLSGGLATKISGPLDGVYNSVAGFGSLSLSSAQANIFGRKVWMTLVRIVDPVSGTTENKLLMTDGRVWWASMQNLSLTYINYQESNSSLTAYGTNGTVVHPLFQTATTTFTKTVQSRLWDQPAGLRTFKAQSDFWMMAQYYSTLSPNVIASIDNEAGTMATQYTITGPTLTSSVFISPPMAVGQNGVLAGMTMRTAAADMALISAMLQTAVVGYRGR